MTLPELWRVVRKIDSLTGLEAKHDRELDMLRAEMADMRARVTRLEAREDIVVAEAKGAAGVAAGAATSAYLSDLVRRVTLLEAHAGQTRLAPS